MSEGGRPAPGLHTRPWESLVHEGSMIAVLLCCGIVYSYQTPFTKHRSISGIQSNTKFWLNPIFFYSSDAHKRWIPIPPKKGNWTQLLELQFDKEESRERIGKHNFLGDTGGIKCTYHTLECSLSRQVCGQNPQKKVFLEYNHWYRAVGISGYDDGLRNHNL